MQVIKNGLSIRNNTEGQMIFRHEFAGGKTRHTVRVNPGDSVMFNNMTAGDRVEFLGFDSAEMLHCDLK